jgi:hypothetical protein
MQKVLHGYELLHNGKRTRAAGDMQAGGAIGVESVLVRSKMYEPSNSSQVRAGAEQQQVAVEEGKVF